MGIADIGIGTADFEDNPLADFGTGVNWVTVTETVDFRGNKTLIFSGTTSITAVFHKRDKTYVRDKEGVRQLAPAYLMHKENSGIKRGDKIVIGSGTGSEWKIINVLGRPVESPIYNFSDLHLWE